MTDQGLPTEEEVSAFLKKHPQFFEQHAELLTSLYLPSQHGAGTVSLAERQQLLQRDRIRVLEAKIADYLKFGEENDATTERIHRLSLGLLASPSLEVLLQVIITTLKEDFKVPHVGIRIWKSPKDKASEVHAVFRPVESELMSWTQGLADPYCGYRPGLDLQEWFGENAEPKSFAMVALTGTELFGLLVMASEDEKRFYPEMGRMYLKRIGELVSASLLRYIA